MPCRQCSCCLWALKVFGDRKGQKIVADVLYIRFEASRALSRRQYSCFVFIWILPKHCLVADTGVFSCFTFILRLPEHCFIANTGVYRLSVSLTLKIS